MNNIYIGYDSREDIAYQVCEHSMLKRSIINGINIKPLKQDELRKKKLYWRDIDKRASTEFTITRFLVPYLNDFKGWAIFCDCDTVWLTDPIKLFELADPDKAVMVVQHDYQVKQGKKMDGKLQTPYPRKNWSSVVLWNCAHPKNRQLDLSVVNSATPKYLHRFEWLDDEDIGELDISWNWLVGWYKEPENGKPKVLHYTEGGPNFKEYRHCEYSEFFIDELVDMFKTPEQ
jgi:lipopolysaccharide biosynthesis glycosyltransferase